MQLVRMLRLLVDSMSPIPQLHREPIYVSNSLFITYFYPNYSLRLNPFCPVLAKQNFDFRGGKSGTGGRQGIHNDNLKMAQDKVSKTTEMM